MKEIFLTGPKHSGKTFASLYQCSFIDIDELVFRRNFQTARLIDNVKLSLHTPAIHLRQL